MQGVKILRVIFFHPYNCFIIYKCVRRPYNQVLVFKGRKSLYTLAIFFVGAFLPLRFCFWLYGRQNIV